MRRTTPVEPVEPVEPSEPSPLFRAQSKGDTPRGLTLKQGRKGQNFPPFHHQIML